MVVRQESSPTATITTKKLVRSGATAHCLAKQQTTNLHLTCVVRSGATAHCLAEQQTTNLHLTRF